MGALSRAERLKWHPPPGQGRLTLVPAGEAAGIDAFSTTQRRWSPIERAGSGIRAAEALPPHSPRTRSRPRLTCESSMTPAPPKRRRFGADQYSSASMTVRTRVVTASSAGSGEPKLNVRARS